MKSFLDTNIFLYAFLDQDSAKKQIAVDTICNAIRDQCGVISLQVVKEFCNVMIKKGHCDSARLRKALGIFESFQFVDGDIESIHRALDIKEQYGIQFFDSLMVAAAQDGECDILLTEDLSDGQTYCGVTVVNPFRA